MGFTVTEQALTFLYACALGAAFGLLYDVFRIIRLAFPAGKVRAFVEDLLYFILCAAATFVFMMTTSSGEVRIYVLLGEALGAVLYFCTASILLMKAAGGIIALIRNLLRLLYRIFVAPLVKLAVFLSRLIGKGCDKMGAGVKKVGRSAKYSLKRQQVLLYNLIGRKKKRQDVPTMDGDE